MTPFPGRGLYAITPSGKYAFNAFITDVSAAIKGGSTVIQYRDKDPYDAVARASALLDICRQQHVPLIINDNIELARQIGADGVHLGRHDQGIALARATLGQQAIIGISCYNSVDLALSAEKASADYVAFGRFFASASKPLATPADLTTLSKARQLLHLPIVAIGGILPENGRQLLTAGADLLAVIGGVFGADPEQSARDYQVLFENNS